MDTELKQLLDSLDKMCEEELKDCDSERWPNACAMQSTKSGKARLKHLMKLEIIDCGCEPGSALAHIEQELSHSSG